MQTLSARLHWARLDEHNNVVPIYDLMDWAQEFEHADRRVAADAMLSMFGDKIAVSTVFLGLNHQWLDGPPLWFETMVFADSMSDQECHRYSTYAEALAGHAAVLRRWYWKRHYYRITNTYNKARWWLIGLKYRFKNYAKKVKLRLKER